MTAPAAPGGRQMHERETANARHEMDVRFGDRIMLPPNLGRWRRRSATFGGCRSSMGPDTAKPKRKTEARIDV